VSSKDVNDVGGISLDDCEPYEPPCDERDAPHDDEHDYCEPDFDNLPEMSDSEMPPVPPPPTEDDFHKACGNEIPPEDLSFIGFEKALENANNSPDPGGNGSSHNRSDGIKDDITSKLKEMITKVKRIENLWNGKGKTWILPGEDGEPKRLPATSAGYDLSLVCELAKRGERNESVLATAIWHRPGHEARIKGEEYVFEVVDRALGETKANEAPPPPGLHIARESLLILDAIPDAPHAVNHIVPMGYSIQNENGAQRCLFKMTEDGRKAFCDNPVLITGWVSNRTTGNKGLELSWRSRGKWRRVVRDRSILLDKGKIIGAIADTGFPIADPNKKMMVEYLVAYQQQNIAHIRTKHISEQMGWQRGDTFLAGPTAIGGDIEFNSADAGEMQLVDAVHKEGDFDKWKGAISKITKFPRVAFALYASFVPPLLNILKSSSFGIDWSYQTSSGKTTTLRVAASVWGSPDERSGQSYIRSWGGTSFGIERLASVYNGLPLLLDDSKRARSYQGKSVIGPTLYTIVNGIADVRATRYGLKHTRYWRTVLLSTGESRLIDATKDGGTAARCLCLWGQPFGETTKSTGQIIRDLNRILIRNYGHAGPKFVEWLIEHKEEWPRWTEQLADLAKEMEGACGRIVDSGVVSRITEYMAILELTGRLVHRALDLPWKFDSPIKNLAPDLATGASCTDRASEALDHAYEWALANRSRFWSKSNEEKTQIPPGGWLGRWDMDPDRPWGTEDTWEWIGFLRGPLFDELERSGYEPESCIRLWADRDWLNRLKDKRQTVVSRVWGGESVRLLQVLRQAISPKTEASEEPSIPSEQDLPI
jgi:hypothetical protein